MDDYGDILATLNSMPAVIAIIAAGILVAAIYFAGWLTNLVASFFDDEEVSDEEDAEPTEGAWNCDFCGELQFPDAYRSEYEDELMCWLCARDDSRFA